MKSSSSLASSVIRVATASLLWIFASCSSHSVRHSTQSIQGGIAAALAGSSLGSYTKVGCLNSLELWSDATAAAAEPAHLVGGLFFLGDSYLVYDFAYLGGDVARPLLALESADATRQLPITATQFEELANLLAAARNDPPPQQPSSSMHTTCVVFLAAGGNYYVVQSDEASDSKRATDKAIALLDQLNQSAP